MGSQDQISAAYGGFNYIRFNTDETVSVDPVICKPETRKKLQENLLFFYTGAQRPSSKILSEQKKKTIDKMDYLKNMIKIAEDGAARINNNDLSLFGEMLHKNWEMKKQLASTISDPFIDESYEKAMKAGATGGKILGAGGGGFLAFYAEKEHHSKIRNALRDLREVSFKFENQGSKIIYVGD